MQFSLFRPEIISYQVTLEPGVPTSFMLQLKNVREVVREDNDGPTGVVVTQVFNPDCLLLFECLHFND